MIADWIPLVTLLPVSLAAGVDLYLTLLFLGTAGRLGWEGPAPGSLGDLAMPGVLAATALLYATERWMEHRPVRSLCWNAAHTVVRPLGAGLLALLAISDLPAGWHIPAALVAGALTLGVHVTRSGWGLLLTLIPSHRRVRFLVSVAEDVGVLALLSLLLDAPWAASGLALFVLALGLRQGRAPRSAFAFALGLLRDAAGTLLPDRRWHGPDRFPRWIRRALEDPTQAPPGGLRGSPAAALNLPGPDLFRRGWVVVRGGSPLFLYRRRRRTHTVDLAGAEPLGVTPATLHTRLELGGANGTTSTLCFGLDGPGPDDLRAEFMR